MGDDLPSNDLFPFHDLPKLKAAAREKYAAYLVEMEGAGSFDARSERGFTGSMVMAMTPATDIDTRPPEAKRTRG